MKPMLLIKTGETIAEIIPVFGDFEHWFAEGLACEQIMQVDVHRGQELPDPGEVSSAVITGSAAMVSQREDWSERTAHWLRGALEVYLPVLGVCYGHQLLAHALGGRVGPNHRGREMGTVQVEMEATSRSDELFAEYPASFRAQASHQESVLELPGSAVRLGRSELDENLVARFTETAWGVQFHPEFPAQVMREYIRLRAATLREEGFDPENMLAGVRESPRAASILPAFTHRVYRSRLPGLQATAHT
jgi:GMP synthase (glutamine-hydrolysing)